MSAEDVNCIDVCMINEARILLADRQIHGLEKILNGAGTVASKGNLDIVLGLIDQLKNRIPSIWHPELGTIEGIDIGDKR